MQLNPAVDDELTAACSRGRQALHHGKEERRGLTAAQAWTAEERRWSRGEIQIQRRGVREDSAGKVMKHAAQVSCL